MHLPDHSSAAALADTFESFFINKISIIRAAFPLYAHLNTTNPNPPDTRAVLHDFVPVSEAEVRRLVLNSPCKSCDLDPIPTTLLRECIDVLVTNITPIVNVSLSEGVFPSCFKTAYVSPLLKKSNLDKENIKNCRPVSNPSLIPFRDPWESCCMSTYYHLSRTKTLSQFQSAYTGNHIQRKLRCWKFIMISYQPWTKARWRRLYCSIFPLRLIPMIIRYFLVDWRTGLGLLGGLTIGWGSTWLAEVNRLSMVNVCPARSISLLECPKAQFSVLCFLPSILLHLGGFLTWYFASFLCWW